LILFFNPKFGRFFTARKASFTFAGKWDSFYMRTIRVGASIFMIAANDISATKQFNDAINYGRSKAKFVLFIKTPPVLVG
jgi:hypothetical protein